MTHYNVDYEERPDREATLDFVRWMGFRTSLLLAKYVKYNKNLTSNKFHLMCTFRGVQGKPVDTFMKHFGWVNPEPEPEPEPEDTTDPSMPMGENGNSRID